MTKVTNNCHNCTTNITMLCNSRLDNRDNNYHRGLNWADVRPGHIQTLAPSQCLTASALCALASTRRMLSVEQSAYLACAELQIAQTITNNLITSSITTTTRVALSY